MLIQWILLISKRKENTPLVIQPILEIKRISEKNMKMKREIIFEVDFKKLNRLKERIQPPLRKAMRSERSFDAAIPAKAIAFPGAKSAGDLSHLSKFPSVHLSVALA